MKLEFDEEFSFVGSDLDLKLKRDYIRHKTSNTKAGEISIYWCRFGKKRGFSCPVKVKIVRKNEKVLFMEEINPKDHDHTEIRDRDAIKASYCNFPLRIILPSHWLRQILAQCILFCDWLTGHYS